MSLASRSYQTIGGIKIRRVVTALANLPIVLLNLDGAIKSLSSYQSYLISFAKAMASWP